MEANPQPFTPPCFARLHDPLNASCQTCALFVGCGVKTRLREAFSGQQSKSVPEVRRSPVERPNNYIPGTCKWAAWEAINRLDGTFTEADIIVPYYNVCRSCKIRPRKAERTIRDVVTELVKARVLTRVARMKLQHGTN